MLKKIGSEIITESTNHLFSIEKGEERNSEQNMFSFWKFPLERRPILWRVQAWASKWNHPIFCQSKFKDIISVMLWEVIGLNGICKLPVCNESMLFFYNTALLPELGQFWEQLIGPSHFPKIMYPHIEICKQKYLSSQAFPVLFLALGHPKTLTWTLLKTYSFFRKQAKSCPKMSSRNQGGAWKSNFWRMESNSKRFYISRYKHKE